MDEAAEFARAVTNGQGADAAIVTVGVTQGEHVGAGVLGHPQGRDVVVTGLGESPKRCGCRPVTELTLYQKRVQGSLFGASAPTADIPAQLRLWRDGALKLEDLVTRRYRLDEIAQGFDDMHAGRNLRGVVVFDAPERSA